MTAPCGSAPAPARWRSAQSQLVADVLQAPRSAARSSSSRVLSEGDLTSAPLDPDRRHRRLRRRASARRWSPARSTSSCTRSRTCPTVDDPRVRLAAVPVREDPRDVLVARDGLTLGRAARRCAGRHRFAAPRRPAQRARARRRRGGDPRQRRHPARQGRGGRVRRRRAGPGRAAPARPRRRGHRDPRPDPDAAGARPGCARGRGRGRLDRACADEIRTPSTTCSPGRR